MKLFLFVVTGTFTALASFGQSKQDTLAVKKVIQLFQDDFNDGSFKNAAAYTTKDWEHINPLGGVDKGREAVLKVVRSVHQTFLKEVSMTTESVSIRFIRPDVALADVIHKVTSYTTPEGVKHENERHVKTYVLVKQKGKWLLTHDHNTIIRAVDTAESQK